ncbi:MAG: DnaJ domain-containing protein [Gloeobacterales cyanobacterium]
MKDFYNVLDIDPETDKEEIRKAYVQLAHLYHPDLSKAPDARERFEEINQAYSILSNDDLRFYYDLYIRDAQEITHQQKPLTWWKRYELAVSTGILALGILVCIALFMVSVS